ncbi:MAG: hypothetical protein WBN82_09505 [Porticoccaceae bacterium]
MAGRAPAQTTGLNYRMRGGGMGVSGGCKEGFPVGIGFVVGIGMAFWRAPAVMQCLVRQGE